MKATARAVLNSRRTYSGEVRLVPAFVVCPSHRRRSIPAGSTNANPMPFAPQPGELAARLKLDLVINMGLVRSFSLHRERDQRTGRPPFFRYEVNSGGTDVVHLERAWNTTRHVIRNEIRDRDTSAIAPVCFIDGWVEPPQEPRHHPLLFAKLRTRRSPFPALHES